MSHHPSRSAYTLIEILVATAVSMILMLAIMRMFGGIGESLNRTRAEMNLALELRRVQDLLDRDLENNSIGKVTTDVGDPARFPGYFTYQEGPMWTPSENEPRFAEAGITLPADRNIVTLAADIAASSFHNCSLTLATNPDTSFPDSTVGDLDDFLAFTVDNSPCRARGLDVETTPAKIGIMESTQAEVAWFVRGTTLYRRILLIAPDAKTNVTALTSAPTQTNPRTQPNLTVTGLGQLWANNLAAPMWSDNSTTPATPRVVTFYDVFDYSVRRNGAALVANGLSNLQERQNRFGMYGVIPTAFPYPCDALPRFEDTDTTESYTVRPGEAVVDHLLSSPPRIPTAFPPRDYWDWSDLVEPPYPTPRRSEDVVMKNVLSFDVKAWIENDPTAPAPYFADLGWNGIDPISTDPDTDTYNDFSRFGRYGGATLPTGVTVPMRCVYDTWWGLPLADAPYGQTATGGTPAALRAVQITIRAYEPQFKTVQEVRVVKRLEQ